MMGDLLLGLDVGTQGVKGALVDGRGRIVAQASVEHETLVPRPDWAEHDMATNWWQNVARVTRQLLATEGVRAERVAGIGVSGLYPAMGPTDANGVPLRPAILYSDNRAVAEIDEVNAACGLQLTSEESTPKLIWFLRHEPELAARMRMYFDAAHYAIFKLCGAYVVDSITPGLHGAIYSSPAMSWRPAVCERFGIPLDILPEVHPPIEIVGTVHAAAAAETGLAIGTPVTAGLPDLVASLISAGATHTDEALAYYGTAGLVPILKFDLEDAVRRPYPVEDGYIFDYPVYSLAVGGAVRWFRDQLGQQEVEAARREGPPSAYARLDLLAEPVPPGSDGLILVPHFYGQRSPEFDPNASGVYFGLAAAHTRGHLFRAVLESFGYVIRHGLETWYPQGAPIRRLVATGGGASSALWRQITSDITGLPQEYVAEADGPVGDAYLAGMALGWFKDFETMRNEWIHVSGVTRPDPQAQEVYSQFYPIYRDLHTALRPLFRRQREAIQATGGARV